MSSKVLNTLFVAGAIAFSLAACSKPATTASTDNTANAMAPAGNEATSSMAANTAGNTATATNTGAAQ